MSQDVKPSAVVLLSGGLDSATVLAIALRQGYVCHALSFDYGQKHKLELSCAKKQAEQAASHRIVPLPSEIFSASALTNSELSVPPAGATVGIPPTYVPARNTVFLALALALAETLSCRNIFIGINTVDYPGYPDCRPEFIEAFAKLATLATKAACGGFSIEVQTPLLHLGKQDIIRTGLELGVDYGNTISCYQPTDHGLACGQCDSCHFRLAGFASLGKGDPAGYVSASLP